MIAYQLQIMKQVHVSCLRLSFPLLNTALMKHETPCKCRCPCFGHIMNAAAKSVSLSLLDDFSNGACKSGPFFGKYGYDIWLNHGCKSRFSICIIPDLNEIVACYSERTKAKHSHCRVPLYIKSVAIHPHRRASP